MSEPGFEASADRLAANLLAANEELVALAEGCDEARWRTVVPGEDWPVGVVVHHVAEGHALARGWIERAARGEAISDTAAGIDHANDRHRVAAARVGVAETIALLRANGAALAELLRSLGEERLARQAPFGPAGGAPVSVAALGEVAEQHVRGHMAHARSALNAGQPAAKDDPPGGRGPG